MEAHYHITIGCRLHGNGQDAGVFRDLESVNEGLRLLPRTLHLVTPNRPVEVIGELDGVILIKHEGPDGETHESLAYRVGHLADFEQCRMMMLIKTVMESDNPGDALQMILTGEIPAEIREAMGTPFENLKDIASAVREEGNENVPDFDLSNLFGGEDPTWNQPNA